MVAFHPIVPVLKGVVDRGGEQLFDHEPQCGRTVGRHLLRLTLSVEHTGEEPPCSPDISAGRDVHVDHLAVLVDGPVDVTSDAGDLDIGLICEPMATNCVSTGPGGVHDKGVKCCTDG